LEAQTKISIIKSPLLWLFKSHYWKLKLQLLSHRRKRWPALNPTIGSSNRYGLELKRADFINFKSHYWKLKHLNEAIRAAKNKALNPTIGSSNY